MILLKGLSTFCTSSSAKLEYLYGINPIQLALAANRRKISSLIVCDNQSNNPSYKVNKIMNLANDKNIPISFQPKDRMNNLVKGQPHQNMIIKCTPLTI